MIFLEPHRWKYSILIMIILDLLIEIRQKFKSVIYLRSLLYF